MLRGILCSLLLAAPVAAQKVFHTVDAALQLAFGDATVERRTEALSDAQRERLDELSGVGGSRAIAFAYVARRDGKVVGTAYFDTHRVRTLRETVMVVVRPDGAVQRVVLCAFAEPVEY